MTRQQSEALQKAYVVKAHGVQVRKELRTNVITLEEALADERAGHLPVQRLLCAMVRFGPTKASRVLFKLWIPPSKLVRDLTDHQRDLIVQAVGR